MWVTQMTLGVKVFKGWCLFVLFQNVICVSQGCLVTGCIVGSPRPQSVFKGGFHWNSNHRQEGMTLSCCHQHFFLPNPKETDSIILREGKDHSLLSLFFLFPVSQGEVHKVQGQSLDLRQKRNQKISHCPNCPCRRGGNLLGRHFSQGPPVTGNLAGEEEGSAVQRSIINYLG